MYDNLFPFYPYFYFVIGLSGIAGAYFVRRSKQETDSNRKIAHLLKAECLTLGIFCLAMVFFLPSTPALSSFGFPKSVEHIQSQKDLLSYLQGYNLALVRTTEVLFWFLLFFTFSFFGALYQIANLLNSMKDRPKTEA
ncbi:MAG: hypothetical protein ACREI9_14885 [Nitrospiraceae bacterium]